MFLGLTTTAFANATVILHILPTTSGLYGLLRPGGALAMLGFPIQPHKSNEQNVSLSLVRMYAVRQVAMGLTCLALWWAGEHRWMGILMLICTPVAGIDGLAGRWLNDGKDWGHWGFMPVLMVLAAGLLWAPLGDAYLVR
jgi:hypothetical protein